MVRSFEEDDLSRPFPPPFFLSRKQGMAARSIEESSFLTETSHRPRSKNADWEEPAGPNDAFDYDAEANMFYFEIESVGSLEPETILQQGIKVMQQKLAAVLQELTGATATTTAAAGDDDDDAMGMNGYGGPRSPELNGTGGRDYEMDQGYTTPYVNGGGASAWGGVGGATPYGATPYGQNGY